MGSYLGTVVAVQVYRNDVVVVRNGRGPDVVDAPRGEIAYFSRKSRQRLAFVAANTDVVFKTMITLTYPREYPSDGRSVKRHFNAFLTWLRRECGKPSYLWFLEFQRRGAPHIHLLVDWPLPLRRKPKSQFRFRVSATWYRLVASGDPRHLAAGTRSERIRLPDGAARYAVKYAHKMEQKTVPKGYRNIGRFWGCSRDVRPVLRSQYRCTEDDIRGVLENWPYAPADDRTLYRVLYGVSDRFLGR